MKKCMVVVAAVVAAIPLFAEIKLGAPFTDGAVLQRGMKVPVWGKATDGAEKIRVEFAGQSKTAKIGEGGSWRSGQEHHVYYG